MNGSDYEVREFAPTAEGVNDLLRLLVEANPMVWLENYGKIMTKKKELRLLKPNPLQFRLAQVVDYMLRHKLPVRILIYKPRQKGSSTGSMGIADWFVKRFGHKAYLCGNELSNCRNLWDILKTYNDHDHYDWGFTSEVLAKSARYGNGGQFHWATAKNVESGRSATLGALVMTEIARWAEDDGAVRDAGKVFSSLMGAVPLEPNTLVIGETTVRGASGVFYEQWQRAKTFEQMQNGDYEPGDFIKVFMPWYVFEDSKLACTEAEASKIHSGSDCLNETERATERNLLTRYKLTPGHVKYFRMRLKACDYDPEERDREEPTTEESGFFAAQANYFNKTNLQHMRRAAEEEEKEVQMGVFEWDDKVKRQAVTWTLATEEDRPLWVLRERPQIGRRYTIGADNSRGLANSKGDPDCHAVPVVRDGYACKETGTWVRPKVVATLRSKCRIDIDVLADEIAKISKFYGGALVVPEANNDCGLIMCLKKLGVNIYERERPATDKEDQMPTGKLGIWTSDDGAGQGMRSGMLGELRAAVRKQMMDGEGIDIPFIHILDEMEHFAINPNTGKAEAMEGWHDDFVMGLAFAYFLRGRGTVYAAPELSQMLPPDVRRLMELHAQDTVGGGGGAHRI
ncbi:MAG: hypothetical protein J0L73_26395 [Verrucomicrobia bacterium]|nr:hypothetical protein [Verrucomicrobiota bacterium]